MPEKAKPLDNPDALAGDRSSKGSSAVKHPERVAKFAECKKRSVAMASYLLQQDDYPQHKILGHSVGRCASYLVFNHYYTVDQVRLAKVMTCKKHLLCPFCARVRAAKQVERYLERFEKVTETKPDLIPVMLTLTVKNGPDLTERFNHLVNSFRSYQEKRRDWKKRGNGFNELCRIDGAVFSYEITNKGNGWHPHLHAVALVDSYIDVKQLSAEWEAITGDSKIVDVRRLKPKNGEMAEAFCEVFKYALKFSEMDLSDNLDAFDALIGKRLQGAFGSLWGVKVPDKMTDDLLDLPYLELFYQYRGGKGYDLKDIRKRSDAHTQGTPTSPECTSTTANGASNHDSTHFRRNPDSTSSTDPLCRTTGPLCPGHSGARGPGEPEAVVAPSHGAPPRTVGVGLYHLVTPGGGEHGADSTA